jgi:diaminopimelate decarboxylase
MEALRCFLEKQPLISPQVKSAFGKLQRLSKGSVKRALRRATAALTPETPGISAEYFGIRHGAGGEPCWSGVPLLDLPRTWGSPLHVVCGERLRQNVRELMSSPPGVPAAELFFSYKTNPVPGLLAELHAHSVGAEVISHYELWLALKLGVSPSQIVYNGPAKSRESLALAIERDIALVNINHREEIAVVADVARALGRRARVGLRVSMSGWAGQFGTPTAGGQASKALAEAAKHPHLDLVGLHVHRGGMIRSEVEATGFVDETLRFVDGVESELGLNFSILDLGGSLGSPSVRGLGARELRLNRTLLRELETCDPSQALGRSAYAHRVTERVFRHFQGKNRTVPRLFLEPGRAVASDAQLLLTRVLGLKEGDGTTFAILDAGINVAESCRSEYHEILPLSARPETAKRTYTLVGPICTPSDTLRWAVRLPELRVGDTLAIMDAGAYFVPFSTAFSFPRPGIVLVDDGRVTALRRAETFEDMLQLDTMTALGG